MASRNPETAVDNKYLFDYVRPRGIKTDSDLARGLGLTKTRISKIRTGREGIGPTFLLRTLQKFPPDSWQEFDAVLNAAYLGYGRRLKEGNKKRSERAHKNPINSRNSDFFAFMYGHGVTIDNEIARRLKVSRQFISQLRSGEEKVTERLFALARSLFEDENPSY